MSGGHLKMPEWWEQTDVVRLTASFGYDGLVKSRPLTVTAAWGQNREYTYAPNGYLLEWDLRATVTSTLYGRAEAVRKEIFGLGPHPPGVPIEPIVFSRIAALTVGYLYDLPKIYGTRLGIGADITVYNIDQLLVEYYGSPQSYHVFLRWRPSRSSMAHMH
jgi:YD repeat-containing protein